MDYLNNGTYGFRADLYKGNLELNRLKCGKFITIVPNNRDDKFVSIYVDDSRSNLVDSNTQYFDRIVLSQIKPTLKLVGLTDDELQYIPDIE